MTREEEEARRQNSKLPCSSQEFLFKSEGVEWRQAGDKEL